MAQSCQDVSAKMMELLYGELPEEVRATVEAHISGCARCTAEREGFEQTRAAARVVLDEPPPARARAAILQAAAAHAAGVQARVPQAAAAAAPVQAPRAAAKTAATEKRSFWDWFRSRWTLPTLATVGAVAVFVLGSRLFLDPKRTYERGKEALAPTPAVEPVAPDSPNPPPPAQPAAGAPRGAPTEEPDEKARPVSVAAAHRKAPPAKAADKKASVAAAPAKDLYKGDLDRLFEGASSAGGRAARPKAKTAMDDDLLVGGGGSARAEERQFAPPPPPRPEAAKAQPAPREKESAAKAEYDEDLAALARDKAARSAPRDEPSAEAKPSRVAAAPPAPAAAPAAAPTPSVVSENKVSRKAKKEAAPEPGSAADDGMGGLGSAGKGAGMAAPAGKKSSKGPTEDAAALALRADRLFAEGRWTEAAAAYRELLRLDPGNNAAGRWRERLAVARTQVEATAATPPPASPPAKAAKKAIPAH